MQPVGEILYAAATQLVASHLLVWVGALVVGTALVFAEHRLAGAARRGLNGLVLAASVAVGAALAWQRRSIFDDAFITFRYIDQWLRGNGLVFNVGEYVEGYSNPLWLALVAGMHLVSGLEIPLAALVLNGLTYLALIGTAAVVSAKLSGSHGIPVAAALLAVDRGVTSYATTGMETLLGALLALMAVGFLRRGDERGSAAAGFVLALATVHRLDHAIFWAAGAATVAFLAAQRFRGGAPPKQAARLLIAYALPFTIVLAHWAFKLAYYGDILPNTYYAKASSSWWVEQGLLYLLVFALRSHLFVVAPFALMWLARFRDKDAPVRIFIGLSVAVWLLYVCKVGGDFMVGRFGLPILPLLLIAAVAEVRRWESVPARGVALVALLTTAIGIPVLPDRGFNHWGQAEENSIYKLVGISPIVIDHPSYREGKAFKRWFTDQGIDVKLSSCCIGMVGYYSHLPLMDIHGLTDHEVARLPVNRRGLPGHEKFASPAMVRGRGVNIARWGNRDPEHLRRVARIRFPQNEGLRPNDYSIVTWDAEVMAQLKEKVPELTITDFPTWVRRYHQRREKVSVEVYQADLEWFKDYYFDHGNDPALLAEMEAYLKSASKAP